MIRFVLDECVSEVLDSAAAAWNAAGRAPLDVVRVGQPPDLPRGTKDPAILRWAERDGRVVVTNDVNTMPVHLAAHLAAGGHSPGVFCIRPGTRPADLIEALATAAHAADPDEFVDLVTFIPL